MTIMWCVVDNSDGELMNLWRTEERAELAAASFGKNRFDMPRMSVKVVEMTDSEEAEALNYQELLREKLNENNRD